MCAQTQPHELTHIHTDAHVRKFEERRRRQDGCGAKESDDSDADDDYDIMLCAKRRAQRVGIAVGGNGHGRPGCCSWSTE